MTVTPPPWYNPQETPADRRRRIAAQRARLLSGTRRAEASINEALLNYGEGEQDENRRRVNEEIERVFPGVTEDEQNPTGMYMPDPKNFAPLEPIHVQSNYSDTHQPMRRRLHMDVAAATDLTSNDPTLGGEVPRWTEQEEIEYQTRKRNAGQISNLGLQGTGEWARSLSPEERAYWSGYHDEPSQEYWVQGNISAPYHEQVYQVPITSGVDDGRVDRFQLFQGGTVPDIEASQSAPYDIDEVNVKEWARNHRREFAKTGIESTEWKQRFDDLKNDIENTIVPINPAVERNYAIRQVDNRKANHLNILNRTWNAHATPNPRNESSSRRSRRPGQQRQRQRPRRSNIEGVARSFVIQNDDFGATTGRGNFRHFGEGSGGAGSYGRLDDTRLSLHQIPDSDDRNVVYSYSTPIAWRKENGTVIVPTQRYSNTTNRHQRAIHDALTDSGYHSPQQIANNMMMAAYQRDRHKQTAGSPVGYKHYLIDHGAHEYIHGREEATNIANQIADAHYDTVRAKQRENAAASNRRPRNSRKPFTRRQQLRLEDAGQLRLPFEGVMPDADRVWRYNDATGRGTYHREETYAQRNRKIMQYPITLGYSPQVRPNVDD